MVAYITAARPYANWQLTCLELSAHTLHAAIMSVGMGLARGSGTPQGERTANWIMVAMLVIVVLLVLLYEVWGAFQLLRLIWQHILRWWAERREPQRIYIPGAEEPRLVEEGSSAIRMDIIHSEESRSDVRLSSSSSGPSYGIDPEGSLLPVHDPDSGLQPAHPLRLSGVPSAEGGEVVPRSEWPVWPRLRRDSDA